MCVIGAGAVGLASALALARRGAGKVTVLDARHVAAGSSGLSVGIIETQYVKPLDIELRVRSTRLFDELEREHGLRIVRNGYLRLAHTAGQVEAFERSVQVQRSLGVQDARVLERDELARLVPDLAVGDLLGALYGPSDGFVDGHLYCALLAELASGLGASVLGGHELLGAEVDSAGRWLLRTGAGEYACDYVVDAAGPWAARVAALFGDELPLAPQRHEAVVVQLPRALPYVMPSVTDYTPGSGEAGLYFRHERPGQLIAGLHTEEVLERVEDPDRYARGVNPDSLEILAEELSVRLPSLADARLAHGWAGLYPVSPDGLPHVGPAREHPTAILASGAGGSGIQVSPVLGELVADWILVGEPRTVADAHRLAPGRSSLRTEDQSSSPGRPSLRTEDRSS